MILKLIQSPLLAANSLTCLSISKQILVSDGVWAQLIVQCPRLSHLSLEGCVKVGPMTLQAIGRTNRKLKYLNLSGMKASSPNVASLLAPACEGDGGLESLVLEKTNWLNSEYCKLLRRCSKTLRVLNLSFCRSLESQELGDCIQTDLLVLESLVLDGCSYLPDEFLVRVLQGAPGLSVLGVSNCFDLSDASMRKALLAGGGDGAKSAKGSWRANHLKALDCRSCANLSDN